MNKQILKLIDEAFSNGSLTEDAKLEIINKGKQLGVDKLEVELIIENYKPETTEFKKCPVCNANLPILSNVCEYCGTKIDNKTNAVSKNEILSNIKSIINELEQTKINDILTHFIHHAFVPTGIFLIITTVLKFTKITIINKFPIILIISGIIIIPSFYLFFTNQKNIKHNLLLLTSDFNKNKNLFLIYYTNTAEIQNLESNFENKKAEILKNQETLNKKSLFFLAALFLILVLIFFIF